MVDIFQPVFSFDFVGKPLLRIARETSRFFQGKRVLPVEDDGIDARDSFPLGETESFTLEEVEPFPADAFAPISGILDFSCFSFLYLGGGYFFAFLRSLF